MPHLLTDVKTARDEFVSLMHKSEEIRSKYQGKPETMSAEEEQQYDRILADADALRENITFTENETRRTTISNRLTDFINQPTTPMTHGSPRFASLRGEPDTAKAEFERIKLAAYRRYLSGRGGPNDPAEYYQNSPEYKAYSEAAMKPEFKAYQADNPAGGGFMVLPQQLAGEVLTLMKDLVHLRNNATVYTVETAESLGVPAIDTDPSDDDWTAELGTGDEESTMAFGKRELRPSPVAKRIKVSKKLLRQVVNSDAVILDRLTYKMGITQEKAFISGSGANRPLGVAVASAEGISTGRDTTAATTTAIAADDVISTFYSLKAQYRARSSWLLNRLVIAAIRKLKDSQNNYLWQPGLNGFVAVGTGLIGAHPETLMSRPIMESEYMPGTIAAAAYVAVLGDWKYYWIADALNMTVQVLYELYAATNQLGYILRAETDGMPVLEEAFARLIMKA